MSQLKLIKKDQKKEKLTEKTESSKQNKINNSIKDERFAKAAYDPKFMAPSTKVSKVKIDKRF
jgi:hypothetical protein